MRLALLFSDLHCNNKQLQNLHDFVVENKDIDVLIFGGDAVNMGEPVWFMEKFIKVIEELGRPFLWVPGNNDFGRAYYKLNAKYKSLEGRVVELFDRSFTGVGGSPASWAGQYEGESMIDKKAIAGSIFLSHVPPPGILVLQQKDIPARLLDNLKFKIYNLKSNLNDQMKNEKIIENCPEGHPKGEKLKIENSTGKRLKDAPVVHVCGHLHYRWGTAYLGQTKVIQLASLETGHYAILDLETLAVKFERF